MKQIQLIILSSALALFTACAATDRLGITRRVETSDPVTGVVSESRELTDESVAVIDGTLNAGAASGGLLGLISTAGLAAWGLYKTRKANSATKVAASIAAGVSGVLGKIAEAEASGSELKVTREDAIALLKAAQNDAGTREAVKALLAKQGLSESLSDKILNLIA